MRYTKKLVLLPIEKYEQMQKMVSQQQNTEKKTPWTSGLNEGQAGAGIPKNDHAVVPLINQDTVSSMTSAVTDSSPILATSGSEDDAQQRQWPSSASISTIDDEHILKAVGQKFRSKASNLLSYIQRMSPQDMSWNSRGELIYKGDTIKGSNIIDLIRTVMHNNSRALVIPGSKVFEQVLKDVNVPITLIGNTSWRDRLTNSDDSVKGNVLGGEVIASKAIDRPKKEGMVKKTKRGGSKAKPINWVSL